MSLKAFMQKLQEQDESDIIYSKVPEQTMKIIPPVQNTKNIELTNNIKVIPPQQEEIQPAVIKFKLNIVKSEKPKEEPVKEQKIENKPKPKELTEEEKIEQLFYNSGTAREKRDIWYEYYNKAQASRKQNSVVQQMKKGRFAITYDNQVLVLPEYELKGKSTNEILNDKWL